MGGQHKKNIRAEKAKVKLKGAKLPKGLNVTKTDFKVRKIEIREQLRESVLTEGGQRQLNLKETLSRLKHHNLKFRTDALRNVRDCVKAGQAGHLVGHLNELLQGIAARALDLERDVRRESFKTLDTLLEALQPQAVSPFFHVLATYLRCAMTHVLPVIQDDSLLMLDVLLQRLPPALLAERSAHTIIANFIDMISRARHDNARSNRTLTLHLGQGQVTTVKWRTKVLQRLQLILATLVQQNSKGPTVGAASRLVFFEPHKAQYYGLLRPPQLDTRDFKELFGGDSERDGAADGAQLRTYVEQLMPLLLDNWLEVRPQQQQQAANTTQRTLLSGEAAASLLVLLDIMMQLWTLVLQHEAAHGTHELSQWMRTSYAASFMLNFLGGGDFPYEQMPQPGGQGDCRPQNLCLVQLMCHFWPQPEARQANAYAQLLRYLQQGLDQLDTLTPEQQLRLVAALRALLLDNGAALLRLQPLAMRALLRASLEAYVQQRSGVATRLLNLLCLIVERPQLYEGYGGMQQFEVFLGHLPQLLLRPSIGEAAVRAMCALCRQQNGVFTQALAGSMCAVLAHLDRLQVTGGHEDPFESKKRIINMFYYARSSADMDTLHAALKQSKDARLASYFSSVINSA